LDTHKYPGHVNEGCILKIYNYSDTPIIIKGAVINDREITIPSHFERWIVKHNGQDFIPPTSSDRNVIMYIRNTGQPDTFVYKTDSYSIPDIWVWVGTLVSFFSFFIIVRVIQKIRTR
jgi:hypothetical protein